MASRTALFGTATDKGDEKEKLVELFKNRAELKKEFANLREEKFRLQQRIKEQKGATARITQKLEHLENLLIDPEWAHTVVVFYQLRALNRSCQGKLRKFAEQLKQQREKRRQDVQLAAWRENRDGEAAELQRELGEHRMHQQILEDRLQAERHRINSMSGIEKVFKGRAVSDALDELGDAAGAAQLREQELLEKLEALLALSEPDTEGLSLADKRSINFMIIAFAQHLYLQFRDDQLLALVKEAGDKSVGAINYGSTRDCEAVLERISRQIHLMDDAADYAEILKRRSALIAEHAVFKNDDDAVPVAGTVATLFAIDANGAVRERDANLLGDNYWGINSVLSR